MTSKTAINFPRGSEWRKWDFHIHTPASYSWNGKRFRDMTPDEKIISLDSMIDAMNKSDVDVFVIMDYWSFDGWLALKMRIQEKSAPILTKKVFPGIELRLVSPTTYRLNVHAIFPDDSTDQELADFKSNLSVALIEQSLSDECLIKLIRTKIGDNLLNKIGKKRELVQNNEMEALDAGASCAEITAESFKLAIQKFQNGNAIPFIPWETYNGLADADWATHYAYVKNLMTCSPIFESRREEQIAAFNGISHPKNEKWIHAFQSALNNKPHLAVSGSDAHRYVGVPGDNDKRGYGNFPSGKCTWIKADPTFQGLLQAMKEPAKRSFIGEIPHKTKEVLENKTFFIDKLEISKKSGSQLSDEWLSNTSIEINPDLVAVIGNKGSGKSALADIIALLGNTKQHSHFSFLKKERFRGRNGDPAKHFIGKISWASGASSEISLSENPAPESVELVRYIPQGLFEGLCNDHASGKTDTFEKELRSVIFSHIDSASRFGANDFDQLVELQEKELRDELNELRTRLDENSKYIANIEAQLQPEVKKTFVELQRQKQIQIDEHLKTKPQLITAPAESLSADQTSASTELATIATRIKEIEESTSSLNGSKDDLAKKIRTVDAIAQRALLLEKQVLKFKIDNSADLESIELSPDDILTFEISHPKLESVKKELLDKQLLTNSIEIEILAEKNALEALIIPLQEKLDAPQREYQRHIQSLADWEKKNLILLGSETEPESMLGITGRISQLDKLPELLKIAEDTRLALTGQIFDSLCSQKQLRESLYKPVQDLIDSNKLIRDEYKLQFQASLTSSSERFSSLLFDLIKRTAGKYRGEDESLEAIRTVYSKYDFGERAQVIEFCSEVLRDIHDVYAGSEIGIHLALKKERRAHEVYNYIFGLPFLEPRYSLKFQNTQIEQLSPGQRGSLLLIFYLLVDKGHNPIVLDQPEDNLDNETVVSLLVPVLSEAKKKRQVIMVTHNPNLAVVCDAEQIIYSSFDRARNSQITYESGAIENATINNHVIDVLEGTKPAFDNRSEKYQ